LNPQQTGVDSPIFKTGARHLRGFVGGFDSHSLPPFVFNGLRIRWLTAWYSLTGNLAHNWRTLSSSPAFCDRVLRFIFVTYRAGHFRFRAPFLNKRAAVSDVT